MNYILHKYSACAKDVGLVTQLQDALAEAQRQNGSLQASFASRFAALESQFAERTEEFQIACRTIADMETRDPDKRIAELEAALNKLNAFDAPVEVQELRAQLAESRAEWANERTQLRAAEEGREQAYLEMNRQIEKCGRLEAECERLKGVVEDAQTTMQQFAHIYPDGFPQDWKPQPEHLGSQVISLCNRQRSDFQTHLEALTILKDLQQQNTRLREACEFVTAFLYRLENGADENDPIREMRRKVHAPLRAKLKSALGGTE